MILHYNIRVTGRVQGVWFRKYTLEAALSYGISGFVSNLEDGSVYAEAEGTASDLERFLNWLKQGSPLSQVEKVTFEKGELESFATFKIRR